MSIVMSSPTFSFDESKFIYKFERDYYTEVDFDLDASFREYFQNFIDSNSTDYNMYVFHSLLLKFKISEDNLDITIRDCLYKNLHQIIKTGMNM